MIRKIIAFFVLVNIMPIAIGLLALAIKEGEGGYFNSAFNGFLFGWVFQLIILLVVLVVIIVKLCVDIISD